MATLRVGCTPRTSSRSVRTDGSTASWTRAIVSVHQRKGAVDLLVLEPTGVIEGHWTLPWWT